MPKPTIPDICARIAKLRLEVAGPRGKSSFAKDLGLSPSTYEYYESSRIPPADVLVRISQRAGVDLCWLLTGQHWQDAIGPLADHPILRRAAELLAKRPDSAAPLAAFLDMLTGTEGFPAADGAKVESTRQEKAPGGSASRSRASGEATGTARQGSREAVPAASGAEAASWIPILGRSAAGVAHFWSNSAERAGLTEMEDLIRRGASAGVQHVRAALATGDSEDAETDVQVVTLRSVAEGQASEFIVAPGLKARHRDAFALRIDGDSMTPEIRHGDIVVASPSCLAADGRPAIIQLVGQIGVTCKLYRRVGDRIHLVPVNEHYDPASYESDKVDWAFSVLARVRC